jgi:uncharacterized protein (DUF1800 family)
MTLTREIHVLNRLSFGPRPGDIERVKTIGVENFIREQLSPSTISYPDSLQSKIDSLETLRKSAPQLFLEYGPPSYADMKGDRQAAQRARQRARVIVDEAMDARLLRAIESPRQLEEVMVNFWFNHFNVFSQKGLDRLWVGSYEEEAIRPFVLGRFRDLLGATAKHPAMLFYLDNWQNTAPNSPGARGQFKGLNENYARELMELHTLGVDGGGYTQDDVITLAKILTGWGYRRTSQRANSTSGQNQIDRNGFFFDANRHDFSPKVFLGRSIKGAGLNEGEQALDILAEHPATARFIGYKLAQYFVSDEPPKALVERLAKVFLETRGDIRGVLETLFQSPEFWDEQYAAKKFKTPYEYVISAARASGAPITNTRPLRGAIALFGMPIYGCLTPDGYKHTQAAWLNPNAMTQRLNFATAISTGRLPLNQVLPNAIEAMEGNKRPGAENQSNRIRPIDFQELLNTLGSAISAETKAATEASPPQMRAALVLGSPDFMHR